MISENEYNPILTPFFRFIKQKDEGNDNVMVFSGICNENNQAIWAVKYLELGEQGNMAQ